MEKLDELLTEEVKKQMSEKVTEIREKNPKIKRVIPIAVEGDEEAGEKPLYIGYFKTPDIKSFSKFMAFSESDQITAMLTLAKDLFVGGDEELIKDDDIFLRGVMPELSELTATRSAKIVNLSKAAK